MVQNKIVTESYCYRICIERRKNFWQEALNAIANEILLLHKLRNV